MPAKVKISLEDDVSGPMRTVARSAVEAGDRFEDLEDDLAGVERATDEVAGAVDDLGADIRALTASMQNLEKENKDVRASQDAVKQSTSSLADKVTAVSTATLAGIEIFKKAAEAGKKAFEIIKIGAEQGNPAAIALVESFEDLQQAMADVANDPGVQDAGKALADFIKSELVPAIKEIPNAWRGTQSWISEAITSTTDYLGITEGATAELRSMNEQHARGLDLMKAQTAEQEKKFKGDKALADVNKELAKIEESKRQNSEREALAAVKSQAELETRIKTQTEALKKLAAEGEMTDAEKQKRLADIVLLESRIVDLKKEQEDSAKKAGEATKKFWDDLKGQQKTLTDAGRATFQKMTEAAQKNVDAMLAKEKAAVDQLAAKLGELKGQDGEAADVVSKVRGSLTDQQVLGQIGANRAKTAEDAARQSGKSDREVAAAGRKARETAFKQARAGGRFDESEVTAAQDQMTQSVIDQAGASGNLTQTQTKALRTAAQAQMELAKNQRQNAADIEAINQALEGVLDGTKKTGQRQRAQRGAAGG